MSTENRYYRVGDHLFVLQAESASFEYLPNLEPFRVKETSVPIFTLCVKDSPLPATHGWAAVYTDRSDADMPRVEMYRQADRWLLCLSQTRESEIVCAVLCNADFSEAEVFLVPGNTRFAVDNASMLIYAFRTATLHTLLFHASVIVRGGRAFLFLGHSGTGKSTHAQLWLDTFSDADRLNDDNPVVRLMDDGSARVYGSPWSGKTACYKASSAPIQSLVQLVQASYNAIRSLRMTQAYPFVLASISGLKMEPSMMDSLYESIARLLELCPVYELECLPNKEAAQLCAQTCSP